MIKITADTIVNALYLKHSKDLFIPECKIGSSYLGCPRFDVWAMKKSWASPSTIGYEIKVDRSDFLHDNKWQNYLPYCNEFYFVCPSKVILPNEVSESAGLMYVSSTGTRIYLKKKAPYRDIVIPDSIFRYILMWRTVVQGEVPQVSNEKTFWENWLHEKKYDNDLGHMVSEALRKTIQSKIEEVKSENEALKKRMESYDSVVKMLEGMDIDPDYGSYLKSGVKRKLKELQNVVPSDLSYALRDLMRVLGNFQKSLNKLQENKGLARDL